MTCFVSEVLEQIRMMDSSLISGTSSRTVSAMVEVLISAGGAENGSRIITSASLVTSTPHESQGHRPDAGEYRPHKAQAWRRDHGPLRESPPGKRSSPRFRRLQSTASKESTDA